VAESLSRRVGIDGKVSYQRGSASDLPFAPLTFDGAYRLHVGMNIADKKLLFAQIRRVLKTGAVFGIYDVMRESDGTLSFPLPWALCPDTSFVESVTTYRALLNATGFEVQKVRSRREFAIEFFQLMRVRARQNDGRPALGLTIPMGSTWRQKIDNLTANIRARPDRPGRDRLPRDLNLRPPSRHPLPSGAARPEPLIALTSGWCVRKMKRLGSPAHVSE
jgi:SAM-dependent methyltransferase